MKEAGYKEEDHSANGAKEQDPGTAVSPPDPIQPNPKSTLDAITGNLSKLENKHIKADLQSPGTIFVIIEGSNQGARFKISPPVRIGRDPGNDVVIDDTSMSGYHAVVRSQGGALHIQDLNSTNGIYLENLSSHRWQRVAAATLVNEMRIKMGRTIFQVEVVE